MSDLDERLHADKIIVAIKEIQGKRLEIAFKDDDTAQRVTLIIGNAAKVARAYLQAADELERLRAALELADAKLGGELMRANAAEVRAAIAKALRRG
jgi:hypothetical protein